ACAVDGKTVSECGKEVIVKTILSEAGVAIGAIGGEDANKFLTPFVTCTVSGGSVQSCLTKDIVAQLPEQARPLAQCIADGGNVADCSKQAVIGQVLGALPKDAQPMGECILLQ